MQITKWCLFCDSKQNNAQNNLLVYYHPRENTGNCLTYTMNNSLNLFPWFCCGGGLSVFLLRCWVNWKLLLGSMFLFYCPCKVPRSLWPLVHEGQHFLYGWHLHQVLAGHFWEQAGPPGLSSQATAAGWTRFSDCRPEETYAGQDTWHLLVSKPSTFPRPPVCERASFW